MAIRCFTGTASLRLFRMTIWSSMFVYWYLLDRWNCRQIADSKSFMKLVITSIKALMMIKKRETWVFVYEREKLLNSRQWKIFWRKICFWKLIKIYENCKKLWIEISKKSFEESFFLPKIDKKLWKLSKSFEFSDSNLTFENIKSFWIQDSAKFFSF